VSNFTFTVQDVLAEPYSAAPQLTAKIAIEETTGLVVHAIALRCQVRIEAQRRGYSAAEEPRLQALFGGRDRWAQTLKPFLWMQCSATVQGFTGGCQVDLPMPCTYDFDVVGSRYLHAIEDGTIPLSLMFSGTVFTNGVAGFGVEQVPWDCDATYRMPINVWQQVMALHYPSTGWIRLDQDVLALLADYRARHGLISWEETVQQLLAAERQAIR
jgi:hypothetical protein